MAILPPIPHGRSQDNSFPSALRSCHVQSSLLRSPWIYTSVGLLSFYRQHHSPHCASSLGSLPVLLSQLPGKASLPDSSAERWGGCLAGRKSQSCEDRCEDCPTSAEPIQASHSTQQRSRTPMTLFQLPTTARDPSFLGNSLFRPSQRRQRL